MTVLVDSSVWIDYFRSGETGDRLDFLIDEGLVVVNDLVLTELIPFLKLRNQRMLITLMSTIHKLEMRIHWDQIIDWQYRCLKSGINGIGIPDLIIAQNAVQHQCMIYSLDSHFKLIEGFISIDLFDT